MMRKAILILILLATACSRRREERREERAEERHEERTEARQEERKEERREERREQRRRERRRHRHPAPPPPPIPQPRFTPWTGILDPSRGIDWSTAGIPGGIPNITTQCGSTLNPSGGDDTATIQAAVNACSTAGGGYVQLAAGTFTTYGTWQLPTRVVLRGMGADQTILREDTCLATAASCPVGNGNGSALVFGGSTTLSANQPHFNRTMPITSVNSKGDTTITVGSDWSGGLPSQLAVGQMVWIAAFNDWFPACGGYPDTVPATSSCINTASDVELANPGGASGYNMDGDFGQNSYTQRAAGQMNLITAVSGNTITLQDPLVDSFRHSLQDWVANSPASVPNSSIDGGVIRGFNYGQVIRPTSQTLPVPHVYVQGRYTASPGFCLTGPNPPAWPTNGPCGCSSIASCACAVTEVPTTLVPPNVACTWQDMGPGTDSSPRLMYWNPAVNVGVENLQIFGVNNLTWGNFLTLLSINNCLYCWVRGIEINRPVGFITQTNFSYHGQIEQNYYTSPWWHGSGTDSVIVIDSATSGFLVQNNIFERTPAGVFTDNGGSGNVIAYNYVLGSWGGNVVNGVNSGFLSHDAFPWFNLQEGNIISGIAEDGIHGGNALGTNFRNWNRGTTRICQPVSGTGLTSGQPTRPPVPTVTTTGGGTTTYTYASEIVVGGAQSVPSLPVTITNGPATLSATTYNTITAPNCTHLPSASFPASTYCPGFTSTTPPPDAPTDKCLIFRCTTTACSQGAGTQIGSIPCDGTSTLQDTGQASTGPGVPISGTSGGASMLPGTVTSCTPPGPNEYTAGANSWLAYQGAWTFQIGQYSLNFSMIGNVNGSQDRTAVSTNVNYPERHKACAICNSHCVANGVTCGGGGTTCAAVTCGASSINYSWLMDEAYGYGGGASGTSAHDTTLAQDTAFHCRNYYHSLQGVEAGDCPSTTVLPPSFYLSSKPAWWGSAQWPPIGPDVSGGLAQSFGYAYNNPAKNCYENVMGGTDGTGAPFLHFNAAACYSGGPVTPVGPTGITGHGTITGQGKIT